ncbi:MAG: NADP-dependent oxidoreductase [Chloroflexi bacterium]|nr:NADP-dependent oxidoreductase [Chloroflexota bacterium]
MSEEINRQWTLSSRPSGFPEESDFELREAPIPVPDHGELLIRTEWLTLDPYMRGRMNASKSYTPGVEIGAVMTGESVGVVVESRAEGISGGDYVLSRSGWQEYSTQHVSAVRKLDPAVAPVSTALGVLGMPGLTAYFGTLDVIGPKAGDTFVVSAASGAVGAVVGQIAKLSGCRVIGTAGSDEKIAYTVDDLGFDAGINYKTESVSDRLGELCPDGIDGYFDNVGGVTTDAVLDHLANGARIAICGQISQYNSPATEMGPRNLRSLLVAQARMQGFLVYQFAARHPAALERLTRWVANGTIKYREDVVEGFEKMPRALIGMMHGANFGKLLVKTAG